MPHTLTIQKLLLKLKEVEASDLHIKIGSPPVVRIASILHGVELPLQVFDLLVRFAVRLTGP